MDDDVGHQVSKLPEANWALNEAGEEDEEEISFSPLVRPRPARGHAVEQWSSLGRLRPRDLDFSELTRSGPGIRIDKIEKRGITFDQLKKILVFVKKRCDGNGVIRGWYDSRTGEQLEYRKLTLAQLHHWLIEPVTTRLQCSYVEAVAKEEYGQLPAWFVGHTWHEPFVDFVRRTMKHGTLGAGDAFWSFAFSTRWHECREMLVGGFPSVECLRTIKSLRVSLTGCTKTSTAEDLQQGVPFLHQLSMLDLQICGSPKLTEARPFGQGISALRALTGLRLGFSGCPSLLSADSLCRSLCSLGKQLLALELKFAECSDLQHLGGGSSSAECPGGCCLPGLHVLRELKVDTTACSSLASVDLLSDEMQALASVQLCFADCTMLTSLEELTRPLKMLTEISVFELCLAGCLSLRSLGQLGAHLRNLPALSKLRLNLSSCVSLDSEASSNLQRCWGELPSDVDVWVIASSSDGSGSSRLPL